MSAKEKDTLLVELGCEELPPASLAEIGETFAAQLSQSLREAGFDHHHSEAFYTPRRIAVQLFELIGQQPEQHERRVGPAVDKAYDKQGKPTQAALGFAKACGVDVKQLQTCEEKGAQRLMYPVRSPGRSLTEQLIPSLEQVIAALPLPQKMHWGGHKAEFIRPVRWLCVLYGDEVLPCELFGLKADRYTNGHRFHCAEPLALQRAKDYAKVLHKGKVIVDFRQRCQRIEQQVREAAGDAAEIEESDVQMSAAMTEWPQVIRGEFDQAFLSLPAAALVQVLKSALKVLPLADKQGRLLPQFLIVANLESKQPEVIRKGYEWVARTRLSDIAFFVEQDRKQPFDQRGELLKDIVFHEQLGTVSDRVKRLQQLAATVAGVCGASESDISAAAQWCKNDLTTDMVQEYPELEGVMGQYYITADGAAGDAVAEAVGEHYRPRHASDGVPNSPAGMALALADKMDSLVGMFSINRPPTGTKDPFGLRRAAMGCVRILAEKEVALDLETLIDAALSLYPQTPDRNAPRKQVLSFIRERLRTYYLGQGFTYDCVDAAMATGTANPLDILQRLRALKQFVQLPEAESLVAANKRIVNLASKQDQPLGEVSSKHLVEAAEKDLFAQSRECATLLAPLLERAEYLESIQVLVQLRQPIDHFFDKVLVMAEDAEQRANRLALLNGIKQLFMRIADFSKLRLQ